MSGGGAPATTEDLRRKPNDNRLGQIVVFARLRVARCDGRFAATISMDIKNLVITIGHEVQELCRDLPRRRYGEYAQRLTG